MMDSLLRERQSTHGNFSANARIAQALKAIATVTTTRLSASQRYALDMIFSKIARILTGDPNIADHWKDISGYAELVVRELEAEDDDRGKP